MYDENNQPLNSGIARKAFRKLHSVSRGQDGFVKFSKKNRKFQGMTVIGGEEQPQNSVKTLGKGKIICSGFFPGLSYMHDSKRTNPKVYSLRNYPAAHRNYIASLKLPAPRVECSDHLVEAHLLESSGKYLTEWIENDVLVEYNNGSCVTLYTDRYEDLLSIGE